MRHKVCLLQLEIIDFGHGLIQDEFSGHEEWRFPDYDNGDIEITGLCAVEGPFDKNKRCEWHLDIKLQRGYLRL